MGKACAVGGDFGGTRIKLGLVDASGTVLERGLRWTPREKGRDGILDELASGVRELGDIGRKRGLDVVGVGVGTPGPLDPTAEIVLLAPNIPGWENLPLKPLLEERVEQDVRLENDANAAALGEYWVGAGHGARTLIFLGLGTGVLTVHDLARFAIITFSRKTQPYEIVRSLFNRPDLPPPRLHASASLATVIRMATDGIGVAVIPTAIVERELAEGQLRLLTTDLQVPTLTFASSWLASPDTLAAELVADIAVRLAQGEDAPAVQTRPPVVSAA